MSYQLLATSYQLTTSDVLEVLIDASKRGDLAKLKDLVGRGANFLKTDHYGMTSLHHAARFGHKEVVKYIIENGKRKAKS